MPWPTWPPEAEEQALFPTADQQTPLSHWQQPMAAHSAWVKPWFSQAASPLVAPEVSPEEPPSEEPEEEPEDEFEEQIAP